MARSTDPLREYAEAKLKSVSWSKALEDIFYFIEHYVPKHLFDLAKASPQQKALLKAVQDDIRYFIIRAPRKAGKTICVAIIAVWLTLRNQSYRVFILSGSEAQAEWLYRYCKEILYPYGPSNKNRREFFAQFLKGEPTATSTEFKEGGWIRYTAASSKQVNAPTADCQIDDEFVLIPRDILQEAWPMVRSSPGVRRFLISTATPDKENTELFLDLLDNASDLGFMKIEWTEKDCPFLQTEVALNDMEVARFFLSEDMFETQYKGALPRKAGRIFPNTFIRQAFKPPDKVNPGFLIGGTPYTPEQLSFQGEAKGGIDWGFDHDTVIIEGYRGLDHKIILQRMVVGHGTSPSDWANLVEDDAHKYSIAEWICDSAGAFQNRELQDKGLRVTSRVFGHLKYGKEWMIGVLYYWFQKNLIIIPDTSEFALLKEQMGKYRRESDGKPVKGFDHCIDATLCFASGWDPRYLESEGYKQKELSQKTEKMENEKTDWQNFRSEPQAWMPNSWREKKEELTRNPWQK